MVRDGPRVSGVVHVRDCLEAAPDASAADLMRLVLEMTPALPVYDALSRMRQYRNHIAVVVDDGRVIGVLSIDDVLTRLLATAS